MAMKLFTEEELNFFKFLSIVLDEFPKGLCQTFETMWNTKIGVLPGYQLWDDSPAVRNMLLCREGGKTDIPTSKSIQDWDCTALFKATIFAKTFALPSGKTLNDSYIKKKKLASGSFHPSVNSPSGDQDETLALAIDQLRRLRNILCHTAEPRLDKVTFDQYVQLAKDAFVALNLNTASIDAIGNLAEADFPTNKFFELRESLLKEVQASNLFLRKEVIRNQLTKTQEIKEDIAVLKLKAERNEELNEQLLQETKKTRTEVIDEIKSQTKDVNSNTVKSTTLGKRVIETLFNFFLVDFGLKLNNFDLFVCSCLRFSKPSSNNKRSCLLS